MPKLGSFSIDTGMADAITSRITGLIDVANDVGVKKVNAVVKIIYATATKRRPKIAPKKGQRGYRVSDPNAAFGVPVATGNLQSSIIKEDAHKDGEKIKARIYVNTDKAPYAVYVEYGTSRMRARPFMRQALNINRQLIGEVLKAKIK